MTFLMSCHFNPNLSEERNRCNGLLTQVRNDQCTNLLIAPYSNVGTFKYQDILRGSRMTFEAYIENIKSKTGRTPEQLKAEAENTGIYKPDMKANELVSWLKSTYGLGHGHSMAIWAVWKDKGWVQAPKPKKK